MATQSRRGEYLVGLSTVQLQAAKSRFRTKSICLKRVTIQLFDPNDSLSPHHASCGCRSGQSNRICTVWVRCSFPRLSVLCDSLHIFVLDNTEQASHRRLVRKMIYLMLCRYAGVRALCVFALVQQWRKRATNACLPELSVKFLVSWYGLLLAPSLVPLCCPSHVLHHSAIDRKVFQPPVLN